MRFPMRVPVLMLILLAAVEGVGEAANATASDQQEAKSYRDIATLDNPGGGISGTGGSLRPSGFTVVPIDTRAPSNCRFAISMATGCLGPAPKMLRVVATDAEGNIHTASSQSGVAAFGNKHGLVTIVCDFPLSERDVRRLTVQQERVFVDLGMVKAEVIIQEEEEERLGILP